MISPQPRLQRLHLTLVFLCVMAAGGVPAFCLTPVPMPSPAAKTLYESAKAHAEKKETVAALVDVKKAIEEAPDYIDAHDLFIKIGQDSIDYKVADSVRNVLDGLARQYEIWETRFPKSAGVEYGFGHLYAEFENPAAKSHLLKAIGRDSSLAKAYYDLSMDASRWGDEAASCTDMGKASALEPDNPDYAFYYANSLHNVDVANWKKAMLNVAEHFPNSERGAQALYWLAELSETDVEKAQFWKKLKADFPPSKFYWSASGMSDLFSLYLRIDPSKAAALAAELTPIQVEYGRTWVANAALANAVLEVREAIASGKFEEARSVLGKQVENKNGGDLLQEQEFALLMAESTAGAGDPVKAYDSLIAWYAKKPEDEVRAAALKFGAASGKSAAQFDSDVWALRERSSKLAPSFELGLYSSKKKVSLADYKGKVVLLTFWFPGCGFCQAEMPHFETVLKRFKGQKIAYLGVNVLPEQDQYVLPFMRSTKFSFTPLRGTEELAEKAYKVKGEPSNFLINGQGRIVYEDFSARDADAELVLQRMIESMLQREKAVAAAVDYRR